MGSTVRAPLSTPYLIASDTGFPFPGLGGLVSSLAPSRIGLAFHRCSDVRSELELTVEFNGADPEAPYLLKEALIRAEADLDFECVFSEHAFSPSEALDFLQIHVDPLLLPSGKLLAIPVSLLEAVPRLFRQAHVVDSPLRYTATLLPVQPDTESARKLIVALAELENRSSASPLTRAVRSTFELLRTGGWSACEQVCIPKSRRSRDGPWLENLIRQNIQSCLSFLPEDLWAIRWSDGACNGSNADFHRMVIQLRDADFVEQMFARLVPSDATKVGLWRPAGRLPVHLPAPNQGNYVFVSYAHANSRFLNTVLRYLDSAGVRYWYDDRIDPGARWDEDLEARIRNAGALIACVSDDYQRSKYCKRELKFADLVDKTILPIAEAKWRWGPGLQMMFHDLQISLLENEQDFPRLREALNRLAPQVFASA